jgi:hypothetical protein
VLQFARIYLGGKRWIQGHERADDKTATLIHVGLLKGTYLGCKTGRLVNEDTQNLVEARMTKFLAFTLGPKGDRLSHIE